MSDNHTVLSHILYNWIGGQAPTSGQWQQLLEATLNPPQRAKALGIVPANVDYIMQAQGNLLQAVWGELLSLPLFESAARDEPTRSQMLITLWNLWLPLARQLASTRQQLERPLVEGILGGQGTGKTTLATVLKTILAHLGCRTLSLSIDDLYKTYTERQRLQQHDPRLIWRGPPGTHDVELGLRVLDQLRSPNLHHPVEVPRFDKSVHNGAGDRTAPEQVEGVDIVLFEGWFVGVRPVPPTTFDGTLPPPLETEADRAFARDINEWLKDYLPLWEQLDRLIVLYPVDYRLSKQWRLQAEHEMIATGKSGMSDLQVEEFVNYFWKSLHPDLFIAPLVNNPEWVDLVVEINPDHSVGRIYQPGEH